MVAWLLACLVDRLVVGILIDKRAQLGLDYWVQAATRLQI